MIRVLFFASVRDQLGVSETSVDPSDATAPATVGELRAQLALRGPAWVEVLGADQQVLVAVNQVMASAESPLADGDEVGFFPPVTGG